MPIKNNYLSLLNILKKETKHTRLFAFIEPDGHGSLSHITGGFLPYCKEEISNTIETSQQDGLFLHYSKNSVHFDLLQPLLVSGERKIYICCITLIFCNHS